MAIICEEKGVDISTVSAFDMRSNEWVIACVQIYENLLWQDYKWAVEDLIDAGVHIDPDSAPDLPAFCMSASLKPLLEFIHKFRLKVAPPPESRAYRKMADLKYIPQRLDQLEEQVKM